MTNHVTFVAPPGWPSVPAGRLPSAGWTPSAQLPPAPQGWVFYRGPQGEPVAPPAGSWIPVTAPVVSQPVPVGAVPVGAVPAAAPMAAAPVAPPVAAPMTAPFAQAPFAQPVTEAPVTEAPADAAAKPAAKRLPLVLAAIGLAVVMVLGVGGFFAYNALFGAVQLTPAQFDRLSSVKVYGGHAVDFNQGMVLGWNWFGEEQGDLVACQKSADFDNQHVRASYNASTQPVGGVDGFVMFRRFETATEINIYSSLWSDCEAAAEAAKIENARGQVGKTDGVAWERYEESAVFWYGNIQVLAVKNFGGEAAMAAEAKAIKAVVDSLR